MGCYMGKKLKLKDYIEKYGDVPNDFSERFIQLWESLNMKEKDIPKLQTMIRDILSIKKKTISFVFYFIPDATPRARYSRFTKAFYVKNALDYKSVFADFISSIGDIDIITTPCEFECITYKPIPSAMNKYEKILAELELIKDISRPDWDNLGKTYSDMVQHGLLHDDSLISDGIVRKRYSIKPRIEIRMTYYTKHDSTYNERKINKSIRKGD